MDFYKEALLGPLSLAGNSDLVTLNENVEQQLDIASLVPSDPVNKLCYGFKKSSKSFNNSQQA
jgi:hypothetical protein